MLAFGKKGYIRTLESVIAIILILLFVYQIIPKTTPSAAQVPLQVEDAQNYIIKEININDELRSCILTNKENCELLPSLIQKNIPAGYDYFYLICDQTSNCLGENIPLDKSVYVKDTFISAGMQKPQIFRIFTWEAA